MKWIPVGRVVSTFGIRGELKFHYYNEVKEELLDYTSLFALKGSEFLELKPEGARYRKRLFYLSFQGFSTVEEVSFLVGKELFVREEDLPRLEEGEYYEYQLIGLEVTTVQGSRLGKVRSLMHTGASDILVVEGESELMIPMVEGFIIDIDVSGGTVRVDVEGLIP
ncbi:MAG TPA: ribosome maturation factor RimM [Syntrophorhabdaceae bacterium]|nr:ribosome maturation factor RimM [Syntrophorhabdaceae bacterium]